MTEELVVEDRVSAFGTSVTRFRHARSGCSVIAVPSSSGEQGMGISVRTVPKDDSGVAHVTEHCVLFSPIREDGASLMDLARECGLTANAVTTHCHTTFFAMGPRTARFAEFAACCLDAVFRAPLPADLFRREGIDLSETAPTGVVYNEMSDLYSTAEHFIRMRVGKELYGRGSLAFDPGGVPAELRSLTHDAVLAFRREFYRADRALLFLSGDHADLELLPALASQLPGRASPAAEPRSELRIDPPPSAPRNIARAYPSIENENANYMLLSWPLASEHDEALTWDWELLDRLLFRDRLSRIMRPVRDRWRSAMPFDVRLERTGPCLTFHFGVSIRQPPDVEEFLATTTAAIEAAYAELRPQDLSAAIQHSLVDAREDMGRTLNMLAWINGPWAHGADPPPRRPLGRIGKDAARLRIRITL